MTLEINLIRQQFPALRRPAIFLDNPAGTQVARQVPERISQYLVEHNANHGGAFATSRESDALVAKRGTWRLTFCARLGRRRWSSAPT